MKILYFITKSNWGGAGRHVFDLASYFAKNGHEIVVVLGGEGELSTRLTQIGIRTISLHKLGRDIHISNEFSSFFEICKIIHKEKPDLVHLHSPKAGGLGALAARLMQIKRIVYTAHGWTFNEERPVYEKTLIAFFSWITMLLATDIITISQKELGQAQMFPFVIKKIQMIYLGIQSPKFISQKDARSHIEISTGPLEKKIVIGTIAELHQNKGLIYLINSFEKIATQFPNTLLYIIGEGEQRPYLESLIKEKKLESKILLAGHVENAWQYLKGFSIFVLPSLKEGLPYSLIEAGYASLPVVTTTVGGIPEIIDDMKSGILIQPKKSDEISHAIQFLLEHKSIQKEYGKALHEKVTTLFTDKRMFDEIQNLYTTPPQTHSQ